MPKASISDEKSDTVRAMPKGSIEIARAAIDAYNRDDLDSVLKDAAPNFEADLSRADGPDRGVYGRDQFRAVLREFRGTWQSARMDPDDFIETDDQIVVPVTAHLVGRDGIEVEARPAWVFTIREGTIERVCLYQEREDALEAAGVSE